MTWRFALVVTLPLTRPRAKMPLRKNRCGEVREWSNRHAWKACVPAMGPWVQIPPSPPKYDAAKVKRQKFPPYAPSAFSFLLFTSGTGLGPVQQNPVNPARSGRKQR